MNITIIITTCIQWPNMVSTMLEWPVEAMEEEDMVMALITNIAVVSTMEAIKVMARPITVAHVISPPADHHHIVVDIMPEVVKGQ
jgi:hypothetical protein